MAGNAAQTGREAYAIKSGLLKPDEARSGAAISLRAARLQLEQVCEMLLRPCPEALDSCEKLLGAAAAGMEASRAGWAQAAGEPVATEEARSARTALRHAQCLLENAAAFYARWQRIRAAMTGGYRADGSLPELRCRSQIFLEG